MGFGMSILISHPKLTLAGLVAIVAITVAGFYTQRQVGAESPTPAPLVTMRTLDVNQVRGGGVLLEQPPADAHPTVPESAAVKTVLDFLGSSPKTPIGVRETILANVREV